MEGLDFKLVIVQGIGFLILFWILKKYLFGRIGDLIKARETEIREMYAKGEQDRDEASKLKSQHETNIAEAEAAAHSKLQEAVLEAKKISERIVEDARKQAETIKEKATRELEQEKKNALVAIRKETVNLTMFATEKLIKESIDKNVAEKLVNSAIKDFGGIS